jgi:hypothetical protein
LGLYKAYENNKQLKILGYLERHISMNFSQGVLNAFTTFYV